MGRSPVPCVGRVRTPRFLGGICYYAGLSKITAGAVIAAALTVPWAAVFAAAPVTTIARPADGWSGCCPLLRNLTVLPLLSMVMSTFVMMVSAIELPLLLGCVL